MLGEGLAELRKSLYDARLSKYGAGIIQPGSKLKALADLTDKLVDEGQKVIIKTNYVHNGILKQIVDAVNHKRTVVEVSGDTDINSRKPLYWQWKNNPDVNVMVTSSVSEESVDLTTGDKPASMILMEPEMTPRGFNQLSGRIYRRGQTADVTMYSLISQSDVLNKMMTGHLQELAAQYGVKVPKKFRPRTIDDDMGAMRKAKDSIVNQIYGGERITKKQEKMYDADEVDRAVAHLEGLVAPSHFRSMKPFELSAIIQTRWRNLGEDQFERLVHSRGWKKWRNLYEDGWEGSASHVTNEIIGKLVDIEEQRLKYTPNVVSVGDGRAYFSRTTGRVSVGVDLDEKWMEQGRKDLEKKGIAYRPVVGSATDTTLPSDYADIVVNSYTIFYLGQDDKRNEVEDCVIETNRILRDKGRFIVSLPYSVDEPTVRRFNENLSSYGFRTLRYLGQKETKSNHMKNGCHIISFEKTENVSERQGKDLSFYHNRARFVG